MLDTVWESLEADARIADGRTTGLTTASLGMSKILPNLGYVPSSPGFQVSEMSPLNSQILMDHQL